MTEDEARTKRCCGPEECGTVVYTATDAGLFDPTRIRERFCIGSTCMAWRSRPQWRVRSDHPWQEGENPKNGPNNEGRAAGFCGLAGAP